MTRICGRTVRLMCARACVVDRSASAHHRPRRVRTQLPFKDRDEPRSLCTAGGRLTESVRPTALAVQHVADPDGVAASCVVVSSNGRRPADLEINMSPSAGVFDETFC